MEKMTTTTQRPTEGMIIMPFCVLKDRSLSSPAKGLYMTLLEWAPQVLSIKDLLTKTANSEYMIRKYTRELFKAGLIDENNKVLPILGFHKYEVNGILYPNRLEVKNAMKIGDKLFSRLVKNGIIKKIEE